MNFLVFNVKLSSGHWRGTKGYLLVFYNVDHYYAITSIVYVLKRETQGLEGSLWTEVPEHPQLYTGENNYAPIELYYSPVLDLFKEGKPGIVRGGIIAEQMG